MTLYQKVIAVFSTLKSIMDGKADSRDIAPDFSEETPYAPKDLVVRNNILYRCTEAHLGPWNAEHFSSGSIDSIMPKKVSDLENDKGFVGSQDISRQFGSMSLSDNATQAQIREAVQAMIAGLKALAPTASATVMAAMVAASAFGMMPGDATKWEDVDPSSIVKDVVEKFSPPADFSSTNAALKKAINNVVDFSENNTNLVRTIEHKAPPPSTYAAVSNAAMNARANLDLHVYTNMLEDTWHYIGLEDWFAIQSHTYEPGQEKWYIVATGTTGAWYDNILVDGQYDDMSLTFTVTEGGSGSLGRTATVTAIRDTVTVASRDMLATTGDVAEVKQMIDNSLVPRTVAMFVIPVNDISNDQFTNKCDTVQLVASTNNFDSSQGSVLFDAGTTLITNYFDRVYTFFHRDDSQFVDYSRRLDYCSDIDQITNKTLSAKEIIVFVDTNCCAHGSSWLREDNRLLVFEWDRIFDGGREYPIREKVWRVIRPIQWFEKLPEWARRQVYP